MPANLTPQYLKAEQEYRRAATPEEELTCLQAMLRELPKHKGTDKLQADLRQKISRAKKECAAPKPGTRSRGLRILRQGAGRVVLIGAPNTGKSRLIAAVTRAHPEVAPYPFTTRDPSPAMMPYEDISVQLIDSPPITPDCCDPRLQGLIRGADLVLLLLDLGHDDGWDDCREVIGQLDRTKTRLDRRSHLDEHDIGLSYTQALLVPNKIDLPEAPLRWTLFQEEARFAFETYVVSAVEGMGLSDLRQAIFRALDVVRVYTKLPTAKEPDLERPFTLRRGGTVGEMAALVHKDLARQLRFARVWGAAVYDGTIVKADYVLHDKDIVELHV
jgi:hypothetical protein